MGGGSLRTLAVAFRDATGNAKAPCDRHGAFRKRLFLNPQFPPGWVGAPLRRLACFVLDGIRRRPRPPAGVTMFPLPVPPWNGGLGHRAGAVERPAHLHYTTPNKRLVARASCGKTRGSDPG